MQQVWDTLVVNTGSGYGECYIKDFGAGSATNRTIYITSVLTSLSQFKPGETYVLSNVTTLAGEYVIQSVVYPGEVDEGAIITTTTPSSNPSGILTQGT